MADDFECPHCDRVIDMNSNPDYLTDLGPSHRFTFECECGATFEVLVEFEPVFYVQDETLKKPTL